LYQIITLIASATIPVVNVSNFGDFQTRVISSIISGIIVVITGLTQLEKYQENWILYRTSAELLKKEKYFFENSTGEYSNLNESDKERLLVPDDTDEDAEKASSPEGCSCGSQTGKSPHQFVNLGQGSNYEA
jgi:hypothetical protein